MKQYNVPQFVDIEDKIFGPFTLKQFLAIVAGSILILLDWMVFEFSAPFWLIAIPVAAVTLFFALGKFNGRSALSGIFPFLSFLSVPKRRIFKREESEFHFSEKSEPKKEEKSNLSETDVKSRLQRLSYVLDQKSSRSEELSEKIEDIK